MAETNNYNNNNNDVLSFQEEINALSRKPLAYGIAWIRSLGRQAWILKQSGEQNSHLFAASKALGRALRANNAIKEAFASGWRFARREALGFENSPDLPPALRGYAQLKPEQFEKMGQLHPKGKYAAEEEE